MAQKIPERVRWAVKKVASLMKHKNPELHDRDRPRDHEYRSTLY